MSRFFTLLGREMRSFFFSPIAYATLCVFLFLTGFSFWFALTALNRAPSEVSMIQAAFNNVFFWLSYLLIFPLITMRGFSEEFKLGTIETLMTAPVRDLEVVLAKWCGCVLFYCILWVPTGIYFVVFQWAAKVQAAHAPGQYYATYLLLLLMGMFYCAVGCLTSVLTRNQIVAAISSLALILVLLFAGLLQYTLREVSGPLRDVFGYFSAVDHMEAFTSGVIDTRPVAWYLSMTVLTLVLTYQAFQTRRWKL